MYAVSTTWADAQNSFLAPEGLIEISCYIPALSNTLVYTKKDLLSFTHGQSGSLVSGELPKNYIEFSLDNSDGRWNPSNPQGLYKYLSDRLKVTLRYGYIINGVEEWIPGGSFYLSEWHTSLNGFEANFVARDVLELMIDKPYTGSVTGTLYDIAQRAISQSNMPSGAALGKFVLGESELGVISISSELEKYSVRDIKYNEKETIAVILQKCANAAKCVMYQDRDGVFTIGKLAYEDAGYVIPKRLSYAYPETEFSRPLKSVSVTYFDGKVKEYKVSSSGEVQTLNNDFIASAVQAYRVAAWISDSLRSRQKISGEFRGDPRLDLFDVVSVESKYGTIAGVVLTDIKVSFNGAFRVTYSGYVRGEDASVTVYCGEVFTKEVE